MKHCTNVELSRDNQCPKIWSKEIETLKRKYAQQLIKEIVTTFEIKQFSSLNLSFITTKEPN